MQSNYISTNRSKHYLKCHLILVTKYRRNILVGQLNDDLKDIFTSIANNSDFEIEVMESDINLIILYCFLLNYQPPIKAVNWYNENIFPVLLFYLNQNLHKVIYGQYAIPHNYPKSYHQ